MSLRNDIHHAYDEVAPLMPGLPARVVQTALLESASRRRVARLTFRLRAPLSLVAVFALIALVVGVFVGGRLVQDWNAFHNGTPAGDAFRSALAQLEARPVNLPALKPGDQCPDGPEANGMYGSGPVLGTPGWPQPATASELAGRVSTSWGTYWYQTYATGTALAGPVLARAQDLRTNQPATFIGNYAAGPVIGTDRVDAKSVQQHLEVVLDTRHPPSISGSANQFEWPVIAGLRNTTSDCIGWQFDLYRDLGRLRVAESLIREGA